MNHERLIKIVDFIMEKTIQYGFQIVGAIIILFAGWMAAHFVAKWIEGTLKAKKIDVTVEKFIIQLTKLIIFAFSMLLALGNLGVQVAPLIAGLSVAGVGIGLALQGPLSNYASGATLIFTKPFKVGDIIDVKGVQGEVKDITLPRTELLGLDGSIIIIPNKHIVGEIIKNYSRYRKLEFNVGVSYNSNIKDVLSVIETILKNTADIPPNQPIKIGIRDFGDSSINIQAFVWVAQSDFINVKFAVNKAILEEFRIKGIVIPFPQRDVHIHSS